MLIDSFHVHRMDFLENPTAVEISERDRVMAEANALAAQGQAARDAWQAEQDKYYADQRANETLEITQGQYAWTDEDDETGEKEDDSKHD